MKNLRTILICGAAMISSLTFARAAQASPGVAIAKTIEPKALLTQALSDYNVAQAPLVINALEFNYLAPAAAKLYVSGVANLQAESKEVNVKVTVALIRPGNDYSYTPYDRNYKYGLIPQIKVIRLPYYCGLYIPKPPKRRIF